MAANADEILQRVKESAGPDAEVTPWHEASLPSIELFRVVTGIAAGEPERRNIAVLGGRLPWLEGAQAMDAVRASGAADAHALAHAACFLLLDRARLIARPEASHRPLTPAEQAVITPPVEAGNLLEFWCFAGVAQGTLHVRIDFATWRPMTVPLDIVVKARQAPSERAGGGPAEGVGALIERLKAGADASSRALAAIKLSVSNHASAVAALAEALAGDADASVRKAVIKALVTVAHPVVRPALEKAARDDPDTEVRSYADWLLGMLSRP